MNPSANAAQVPAVVLDTNAVLDWLVFGNAGMARLAAAIKSGGARWLATPRMREELLISLSYPSLLKWKADSERTLAAFDHWSVACPEPVALPATVLRCSDPDDQVFIDLAVAQQARWLVTHDRALHKLARRAATAGVCIVRPNDWQAS